MATAIFGVETLGRNSHCSSLLWVWQLSASIVWAGVNPCSEISLRRPLIIGLGPLLWVYVADIFAPAWSTQQVLLILLVLEMCSFLHKKSDSTVVDGIESIYSISVDIEVNCPHPK